MTQIEAVRGDITTQVVDAIVNAANSSLLGGGGVDGAVHRAGGPAILAACRELRSISLLNGLPTGDAVATAAGRLQASWVIHTVGPVHSRREDRTALLESAYSRSLEVAASVGARSIAFPAISAGVYGWPMEDAARVAVRATRRVIAEREAAFDLVRFVLFTDEALRLFETSLAEGVE